MKYEEWRKLPDPAAALQEFLERSYSAVASLSKWDGALVRRDT